MELITEWKDGDTAVTWHRDKKGYVITYGLQETHHQNNLIASHKFGECIRHSLECAGRFDYGQ